MYDIFCFCFYDYYYYYNDADEHDVILKRPIFAMDWLLMYLIPAACVISAWSLWNQSIE